MSKNQTPETNIGLPDIVEMARNITTRYFNYDEAEIRDTLRVINTGLLRWRSLHLQNVVWIDFPEIPRNFTEFPDKSDEGHLFLQYAARQHGGSEVVPTDTFIVHSRHQPIIEIDFLPEHEEFAYMTDIHLGYSSGFVVPAETKHLFGSRQII